MLVGQIVGDEDRYGAVLVPQLLGHGVDVLGGHLEAGPSIPLKGRRLG